MAISMKVVACVVVMCMAVVSAPIAQAITCGQVISALYPCMNYLKSGGNVPTPCCTGVRSLVAAAKSTADKQTACSCLKQAASTIKLDEKSAQGLPGKCGVSLPYKISTSTNCNNIKF